MADLRISSDPFLERKTQTTTKPEVKREKLVSPIVVDGRLYEGVEFVLTPARVDDEV